MQFRGSKVGYCGEAGVTKKERRGRGVTTPSPFIYCNQRTYRKGCPLMTIILKNRLGSIAIRIDRYVIASLASVIVAVLHPGVPL